MLYLFFLCYQNTYILCDIGIAITKEVSEMLVSPVEDLHNIPLPSLIYRALEPTEDDVKVGVNRWSKNL